MKYLTIIVREIKSPACLIRPRIVLVLCPFDDRIEILMKRDGESVGPEKWQRDVVEIAAKCTAAVEIYQVFKKTRNGFVSQKTCQQSTLWQWNYGNQEVQAQQLHFNSTGNLVCHFEGQGNATGQLECVGEWYCWDWVERFSPGILDNEALLVSQGVWMWYRKCKPISSKMKIDK